jgi:hypothetical protein
MYIKVYILQLLGCIVCKSIEPIFLILCFKTSITLMGFFVYCLDFGLLVLWAYRETVKITTMIKDLSISPLVLSTSEDMLLGVYKFIIFSHQNDLFIIKHFLVSFHLRYIPYKRHKKLIFFIQFDNQCVLNWILSICILYNSYYN